MSSLRAGDVVQGNVLISDPVRDDSIPGYVVSVRYRNGATGAVYFSRASEVPEPGPYRHGTVRATLVRPVFPGREPREQIEYVESVETLPAFRSREAGDSGQVFYVLNGEQWAAEDEIASTWTPGASAV